jgi:hypothetical protein
MGQGRPSLSFRVGNWSPCACASCTSHHLSSHSLRPTYIHSHHSGDDIDLTPYRLVSRWLGVTATSTGPSRVWTDAPRSSRVQRPLRPFKKALPVSLAESNSHSSHSGAALQRAAARRSSRTSVRKHHTLVARYIKHFGSSLLGRGLRTARFPDVMIISAAQWRPRSWNKTNRTRNV